MSNESEMKLYHGAVEPGVSMTFKVAPAQGLQFEGVVPTLFRINPSCAANFRLVSVAGADSGPDNLLVDLPVAGQESSKLRPHVFPKGDCLVVWIVNVSTEASDFHGSLFVRPATVNDVMSSFEPRSEPEDQGILSRCWSWFRAGLEAAIVHHTMGKPVERVSAADRQHTVLCSIRRLCSDFVDAAEIPLLAASLYWKSLATSQKSDEISVGVGPESVQAGETVSITVRSVLPFRPRYLRLDPRNASHFKILSVSVGGTNQFLTPSPVRGFFADGPGIALGGRDVAGPGSDIVVRVSNDTTLGVNEIFEGVLDGELC